MRVEKINISTENKIDSVVRNAEAAPMPPVFTMSENITSNTVKEDLYKQYGKEFIDILTVSEGLKHALYKDSGGNKTIGFGHNISVRGDDEKYKGRYISEEEAYELLKKDLNEAEKHITKILGEEIYNSLTEKQKGAVLDIAFNTGFRKNPKLVQALKEGRLLDAMKEMNQIKGNAKSFNFSYMKIETNNVVISGLALRRIKDISLFLQDVDLTKYSNEEIQDFKNSVQRIYDKGLESTKWYKKGRYKNAAKKYLDWLK